MPFLFFLLYSAAEIYSLVSLGSAIGGLGTVLWVFGTAMLGIWLIRVRGEYSLQKIQKDLQEGKNPENIMLDNLLIFLAGAMFILPGLISDCIGFILLIPFVRHFFFGYAVKAISRYGTKFDKGRSSASYTVYDLHSGNAFHRKEEAFYSEDDPVLEYEEPPRISTAVIIDTDAEKKDTEKKDE